MVGPSEAVMPPSKRMRVTRRREKGSEAWKELPPGLGVRGEGACVLGRLAPSAVLGRPEVQSADRKRLAR